MRISIPKPCNEKWSEMTPEQQGAFCKVCSKVVVDFSKMNDEEVIAYLEQKKGEKTCGRFRAGQLSPYELKINLQNMAAQSNIRKIFTVALFIFFSSLFVCKSDTGDNIVFNKVITDLADTTSVTMLADSTGATDITVAAINNKPLPIDIATVGEVNVIVKEDTIPQLTIIDSVIAKQPLIMGLMVMPEPKQMINGREICPEKSVKDSEKKFTEKRPDNGEVMGDVAY
ncbi:MAG TPA: hypothetical protein VK154_17435 [Chitinophagales bacterium]|nr:hypothetical protein [Chitinophagales bacterium]